MKFRKATKKEPIRRLSEKEAEKMWDEETEARAVVNDDPVYQMSRKEFYEQQTDEERRQIWAIRDTVPLEERSNALQKLLGRNPTLMELQQAGLAHVLWDDEDDWETPETEGPDPFDDIFKIFSKR